ncbi:hypothetical protein [Arenimonas oryziterrae]|uniref:Lipoprotein n=1 Tax=Arenimonas oryziterrae DSM 21050 = YC6267 TaxID=1121015 RepID=A0A091BF95_9GAMM|nr:hypothetical protein [Arenimonas oryziterrae]KFN43040.1 hypothetical protein N789_10790 [Arenimonas oryziterrae DSM 21050 = YC6267]
MNPPLWLCGVLALASQCALAQDCVVVDCGKGDRCDVAPTHLTATLPAGLVIRSIRGDTQLFLRDGASDTTCRRVTRLSAPVSLDHSRVYGAIALTGTLRVRGLVRFEPNDGGVLEFRPAKRTFLRTGKFFNANFQRIKLDEAMPPVHLVPPKRLGNADCWQASATAELSGFHVLVGDSSSAGSYAQRARLTNLGDFTRCQWGGD